MVRGLLAYLFFASLSFFDGRQSQQSTPFRKVGNNSNTNNNSSPARVDYISDGIKNSLRNTILIVIIVFGLVLKPPQKRKKSRK